MQDHIVAELVSPGPLAWAPLHHAILRLEHEAFGSKAFPDEWLSRDFQDTESVIVILKDTVSEKVVGFTYAKPEHGDTQETKEDTALIWDIVVDVAYRRRGLVGRMLGTLETELRRKGYQYIEQEAAVANNYAANIAKHYKDRIVEQSEPHDSEYGQQVFFRIRL
jgi:ribosomal protein S18 acetylase RimI-like enzyme